MTGVGARLPIVQYWHSGAPPSEVADLVATFPARNPDLEHLLFDEPRAAAFTEERFGPRHAAAFRACAVPAMQADYFRYCAILALGGIYADADMRCTGPLRPLLGGAGHLLQVAGGGVINAFFAFGAPRHPLLALSLEIATRNVERRVSQTVLVATGPGIFTGLYFLRELGSIDALRTFGLERRLPPSHAGFKGANILLQGGNPSFVVDGIDQATEIVCEVVAEHGYEHAASAVDDVRLWAYPEETPWLTDSPTRLAYKRTDVHWKGFKADIYR